MKKLLMFASAVTIAASAFAVTEVFDYKANVKYVNLKPVWVQDQAGNRVQVFTKYVQSATIKGYVVLDCNPAASQAQVPEAGKRGFLVVMNSKVGTNIRDPKIIPARIDVAAWRSFKAGATTAPTEGYLYAGGPIGVAGFPVDVTATGFNVYDMSDYAFESRFLFGIYNDADISADPLNPRFADAWLNHAGFGKAKSIAAQGGGCGLPQAGGLTIDSLSGSVKGGMFLCKKHGELVLAPGATLNGARWDIWHVYAVGADWSDGYVKLSTTDVISGTWSMKRTTKVAPVALVPGDLAVVRNIEVNTYLKAAAQKLEANYPFVDAAAQVVGQAPQGLVFPDFALQYGL